MNKFRWLLLLAVGTALPRAQALQADFGVSSAARSSGSDAAGTLTHLGVSDVPLAGGRLSAAFSTRAASLGLTRGLALPPLGALSLGAGAQFAYAGGSQVSVQASGTLGPVALNLGTTAFTTWATTFDPLADWTLAPTDERERGVQTNFSLRYRLSRARVLDLGGELGPQNSALLLLENRRELTRSLPPAEGDDPAAPPETERTGTLTSRVGVRAGHDVLGVTGGVEYAAEDGRRVRLDAQLGPGRGGHAGLGLLGRVALPGALGEGSTLEVYSAYEPWRENVAPLRLGASVSRPVGPGTLTLDVRGGRRYAGADLGVGAGVNYSFTVGKTESAAPEEPETQP